MGCPSVTAFHTHTTHTHTHSHARTDNFLFLSAAEDSPLKATDFGLSIRHAADEPKLTSRSGTPAYMAPELVMQCYGEQSMLLLAASARSITISTLPFLCV